MTANTLKKKLCIDICVSFCCDRDKLIYDCVSFCCITTNLFTSLLCYDVAFVKRRVIYGVWQWVINCFIELYALFFFCKQVLPFQFVYTSFLFLETAYYFLETFHFNWLFPQPFIC